MSNKMNKSIIRAAVDKERQKTTLKGIYKQKYKNLKGVTRKVKVNYAKKPKKRNTGPKREIYDTHTEYANMPKTTHDLPKRYLGETFEEYYHRIRSGVI